MVSATRLVLIETEPALSTKPFASTVKTGIAVVEPYVPAVTVVCASRLTSPVNVPPAKLPLASRAMIAEPVFAAVAVVAELFTLPAVLIVASLVSAIAASDLISALMIVSAVIAALSVTAPVPSKDTFDAVTSPDMEKFCPDASDVAVEALPVTAPVRLPSKLLATRVARLNEPSAVLIVPVGVESYSSTSFHFSSVVSKNIPM